MHPVLQPLRHALLPALILGLPSAGSLLAAPSQGSPPGQGQDILFSISFRGPTISQLDSGQGVPTTEGDLLAPAAGGPVLGPQPRPRIVTTGGALGLGAYTACLGHPPGTPCGVEVDALSRGYDLLLVPHRQERPPHRFFFSVDFRARGIPGPAAGPSVRSEAGPIGDAAGDVMGDLGLAAGPLPPPTLPLVLPAGNVGILDGNGLSSASGFAYPGLGIVEPALPAALGALTGDDLNALDLRGAPAGVPEFVFFSLDAGFIDPLTGLPNSGSAAGEGASAAAILRSLGGVVTVYATPQQLGLELESGDVDDVNALALRENGDGIFQPSLAPYDWVSGLDGRSGAPRDMLLFSVRRGSSIIGRPDSIFGLPIEPGDILVPPLGGIGRPGIFIAAENLGLATVRSGTVLDHGDDLDALSIEEPDSFFDCNENGIEDSVDIALGISSDTNLNGIPDECEVIGGEHCHCTSPKGPCANHDPGAGCRNSSGAGAHLSAAGGGGSVTLDDLVLRATSLPVNQFGLVFMGGAAVDQPFGDGRQCVTSGGMGFHRFPLMATGPAGEMELSAGSLGAGLVATSQSLFAPSGWIQPGQTWHFQCWFRDTFGPCTSGFNLSNAMQVTFTP